MSTTVSDVIHAFNRAFVTHDPEGFDALVAEDCVMEAIEPAPDGARYEGKAACVAFWMQLIEDRSMQFTAEKIDVATDTATIRWRLQFGPGPQDYVRGANLMRVHDGRIVEALGYGKTPAAENSPLADIVDAETPSEGATPMLIVSGHTRVDPDERDAHIEGFTRIVEAARQAPGCQDFVIAADLLDRERVYLYERWESKAAVEAFRKIAPQPARRASILSASVAEYDIADERVLFSK